MKLAIVTRAIYGLHGYGGMERHCRDWIHAMVKQGCQVHVVTIPPHNSDSLSEYSRSVSFYFVPGVQARSALHRITSYPQWVYKAGEILHNIDRSEQLDAVYAHGLSVAGCDDLKAPVYYNPHG